MEATTPLEVAARLVARDQTYCWHPYTQTQTADLPIPIVGARGAELYTADGETLIDASASWWVNLHGHSHPILIEAIAHQAAALDHVAFTDLTHEPAVRLAERLTTLLPGHLQRVFYSDNGSTAVETALKIVMQRQRGERCKIAAFRNGYHGETLGAVAVSCRSLFGRPFTPYLFDVVWIDPPLVGQEERSLQQLQHHLATENVGGFIFEPWVQGAGGMVPHSIHGLSELVALCKTNGVVTIADEVFTGCGRLGPNFACDYLANPPDIICLAKALTGGTLPLGVTACSEALFEEFLSERRDEALLHGHSYCANPIGCAVALASLELLEQPECVEQRRDIASRHQRAALAWQGDDRVARVSTVGTLLAVELAGEGGYYDSIRDSLTRFFMENGVLMRPLGNTICVVPPYCISPSQLERIYSLIDEAVERLAEESYAYR